MLLVSWIVTPINPIHTSYTFLTGDKHNVRLVAAVVRLELHGSRPALHRVYPQRRNKRKWLLGHSHQEGQQNIKNT